MAKDRTILAAAIGGVFAVVGSAVGALISTHQGASAPSARSTVIAGVSAPAPGTPALTTPAAMSSAPPAATTSAPTFGVAAGLNTPPGPASAYTLLWQQVVTIGSGGLLFERAGPEPALDPIDAELSYFTPTSGPIRHVWSGGTFGDASTHIYYFRSGPSAPGGCTTTITPGLGAFTQTAEVGQTYCVYNFYTKTVVYLKVIGLVLNGAAVEADAIAWAYT